jgi:antitoxin (DNA-binding transcriptional repressor) of toxin-antitoxin stability system
VIGATLIAPGKTDSQTLPAAATIAQTSGYEVSLKRPAKLVAGAEAGLTFSVTRNGKPVTDLQPYLGAYGHLVALHSPELAYSHVHPSGKNLRRGSISFDAELHKAGPYRLFLQFRTNGRVHTAAFTQLAVKP